MNADIQGALNQLNKSWRAFTHKGKKMSKEQVRQVLEYGIQKGYKHTGQLTDEEVDNIINPIVPDHIHIPNKYGGHATFSSPPDAKTLEAVNKMAELAFNSLKEL